MEKKQLFSDQTKSTIYSNGFEELLVSDVSIVVKELNGAAHNNHSDKTSKPKLENNHDIENSSIKKFHSENFET